MNRGLKVVIVLIALELLICFGITSAIVIFTSEVLKTYLPIWARVLIFISIAITYMDAHFFESVYISENNR